MAATAAGAAKFPFPFLLHAGKVFLTERTGGRTNANANELRPPSVAERTNVMATDRPTDPTFFLADDETADGAAAIYVLPQKCMPRCLIGCAAYIYCVCMCENLSTMYLVDTVCARKSTLTLLLRVFLAKYISTRRTYQATFS